MPDVAPEIVCVEELVVDFALPLPVTKVATVFYAYDEGCDDTGIYGDGYFAHFDDALWATARTYANEEYGLYRTPPKPLTWRKHHHLWRLHDGDSPTDIVVSDSPLLGSAPSTGAALADQPQDAQPERDGDDDVRAVAATLAWIRAEIAPERKLLGAIQPGAWIELEDRFMDRIAELDAREAKASGR